MSNFRSELYRRYVSTFKGQAPRRVEEDLSGFFAWCDHKYAPLVEALPRDGAVLELGCGPGHMMTWLRRLGFTRIEGIDISAEQVDIALAAGLDASVADVFDVLEGGKRWRAILALDFFEHFSKDELMRMMPAIRDALEPGGVLILQTPNGAGLFPHQIVYGDLTHMTIFTPESMRQLLTLSGFEDARFSETGPAPKDLKGRLRLLAWRGIRGTANLVRAIETGKTQQIWTENLICRCRRGDDAA